MKKVSIGLLIGAMVIVPLACALAQGSGPPSLPVGPGSLIGVRGPIELKDYYSLTPECQRFYEKTEQLRKDYMVSKFDCNEELREKGKTQRQAEMVMACSAIADKIEKEQPQGVVCPW